MKTIILATIALVTAIAAATAAPAHDPRAIRNPDEVSSASNPRRVTTAYPHRTVRQRDRDGPYAQSPATLPVGTPSYGQRWPGARYDANGYYIDPNSPGRW